MELSKEKAIELHRQLWNWIADETEKEKRCVDKWEAFAYFGWPEVEAFCWCCEYNEQTDERGCDQGQLCILKWPEGSCIRGLFYNWQEATDPFVRAKLARQIANFPVNEDV